MPSLRASLTLDDIFVNDYVRKSTWKRVLAIHTEPTPSAATTDANGGNRNAQNNHSFKNNVNANQKKQQPQPQPQQQQQHSIQIDIGLRQSTIPLQQFVSFAARLPKLRLFLNQHTLELIKATFISEDDLSKNRNAESNNANHADSNDGDVGDARESLRASSVQRKYSLAGNDDISYQLETIFDRFTFSAIDLIVDYHPSANYLSFWSNFGDFIYLISMVPLEEV